jgi:hypothetical protein
MRKILVFSAICLMLCLSLATAQEPEPRYVVLLDETLLDDNADSAVSAAWLSYALSHVNWVKDNYVDKDPVTDYKLTFDEELLCRNNMVQVWFEIQEKTPGLKDSYLDEMLLVRNAGFLDEYVWTYHSQEGWPLPKDLQLEEFNVWLDENLNQHQPTTLARIEIHPE